MRKYYTGFSVLFFVLLFLMSVVAIPTLILNGDFANLAVFLAISAVLVGVWAYLFSALALPFCTAEISDSGVLLESEKKSVSFRIEEISEITETPCRYVFAVGSRKYSLTKYGFMKIKNTDIAAEISRISEKKIKQRILF